MSAEESLPLTALEPTQHDHDGSASADVKAHADAEAAHHHGHEEDEDVDSAASFDFASNEAVNEQNSLLRCSSPLTLPPSPTLLPLSTPPPSQLDLSTSTMAKPVDQTALARAQQASLNQHHQAQVAAQAVALRQQQQQQQQQYHHQQHQQQQQGLKLSTANQAQSLQPSPQAMMHMNNQTLNLNMGMGLNMSMMNDHVSAAAAAAAAASVQSYFQNEVDAAASFSREFNELQKSVASMEAAEKQMTEDMTSEMVEESTELEQDDKTNIVGRKRRAGANVSIDLQTKIRLIELAEEYQYDPKSSGRAKSDGPQSSKDQMSGIRLAAQFGLNKSTVSRILKRKEEFKKAYYKDNISGCSKHINKKSKFEKLNRLVENWFDVTREKKVGVSDTLIRDVGKRFAEELGIEDFRGSNGWVRSLRNRKENQARNMSLEALEREKLKKEAEAIERMRAFFPNGTNDMAAFFKDLAIFIEKDCGGAGGPGSFGDSPSSAAGNASNGTAASCFADQLDVTEEMKPDKETDESLRRRMVDSLRMWSHELLEVELTKMKRRLKPQVTPTASAASAALAPALGSLESMQPVATDADATASSTPRQTAIL